MNYEIAKCWRVKIQYGRRNRFVRAVIDLSCVFNPQVSWRRTFSLLVSLPYGDQPPLRRQHVDELGGCAMVLGSGGS